MAIFTQTDCLIIINGVTLSDHGNSISVQDSRDKKDVTAFGATSKQYMKGLGDAGCVLKMWQDFAAGKTHATLSALISSSTPIVVELRPTSAARSATNPAALFSAVLLFEYQFLDGDVGEPAEITAEFTNAPGGTLTYPTA